jgi:hypothetical protein
MSSAVGAGKADMDSEKKASREARLSDPDK